MLRGGQLAWCCTTGEYGRGSYLSVPEEEFNEDFFFFLNLKNLNISKEMKILIFFFWKIWKSWIFSRNWKFWLIFFFFWKIKKSWSFEGIWKFLLKICSLEIFLLEYGFGDFSFEKWRIFLLKMEIFFFKLIFFFFGWKNYHLNENNFGWKLMWIAG